ncbi:permease prefix domain 1-containing protein [Cytobacillus gottheilii]|uniref:permease prefix domain 1-containing protein n=1 Tax=Cytobacillus gottheilii TaxID=859144 RepID=UPI003CE773D1
MKMIEEYVNKVYQHVKGDEKEIQELKEEMKTHLIEAVHELKVEGKTEKEAFHIAIERFGGESELRSVVSELFKIQKVFAARVLYAGIAIFLLSAGVFGYFLPIGNERVEERSTISHEIADMVEADPEVLDETKSKVDSLLIAAPYIKHVNVYLNGDMEDPVYEMDQGNNQTLPLIYSSYGSGSGSGNSFVRMTILDYRDIGILSLFFGVTCFGVLFIIWLIINLYHRRKSY